MDIHNYDIAHEMDKRHLSKKKVAELANMSSDTVRKAYRNEVISVKYLQRIVHAIESQPIKPTKAKKVKVKNEMESLCCVCMCGCYGYPKCSWILDREPVKGWVADETSTTMNRGQTIVHSFKVSTCPQFIQEPIERMNKRGEYRLIDRYEIFKTQQIRQ